MELNEIAIIDADFIGRKNHRFPNLTCMKISAYYKLYGWFVKLKTDYDGLDKFHKVYIAKVFSDTPVPDGGIFGDILKRPNVIFGGTGFFFDKAEPLPDRIEHVMPDYHLYDGVAGFHTYTDYSIGFLTRGCFRHCPFCVNRRSSKVVAHSPLKEFFDPTRPKICLLDDNFFGFDEWKDLLLELQATGKKFVFKQGLDVRLLDDEKASLLFKSRYDGDFIFAFDDVNDAPLIEEKLRLMARYLDLSKNRVKFYVLCGFDRAGKYDADFWERDLQSVLDRAELLKRYGCLPYVMRHENYRASPHRKLYNRLTDWANQPRMFLKKTFAEYVGYEAQYRKTRRLKRQLEIRLTGKQVSSTLSLIP